MLIEARVLYCHNSVLKIHRHIRQAYDIPVRLRKCKLLHTLTLLVIDVCG